VGSSQISSIYSAIAALAPTPAGGVTVNFQPIGSVTQTLHSDMLPMRKLQAFANDTGGDMAHIALGNTINVEWKIADRFFYRFANQGQGWEDFADDLVLYVASYINILRTNRSLGLAQAHITGVSFVPMIYDWHDGSKIAGVDVILTVQEVIT